MRTTEPEQYDDTYIKIAHEDTFVKAFQGLIKITNSDTAVIFGKLINYYIHMTKKGWAKNGWFYLTQKIITNQLGLSEHVQTKAVKNLQRLGLLEVQRRGIPAKLYYRILLTPENIKTVLSNNDDYKEIDELNNEQASKNLQVKFLKNLGTGPEETPELYNKIYNNRIKLDFG